MFSEYSTHVPRGIIFVVGGILMLIGLLLVFLGLSPEAKLTGLVIIGPIPFFFYSEEPSATVLSLAIFIFFIILIVTIFAFLALKKSSLAPE